MRCSRYTSLMDANAVVSDLEVDAAAESAHRDVDDGDDADGDVHADGQCGVYGFKTEELVAAGILVDDH